MKHLKWLVIIIAFVFPPSIKSMNKEQEIQTPNLDTLPPPVIAEISKRLPRLRDVANLTMVCKSLHAHGWDHERILSLTNDDLIALAPKEESIFSKLTAFIGKIIWQQQAPRLQGLKNLEDKLCKKELKNPIDIYSSGYSYAKELGGYPSIGNSIRILHLNFYDFTQDELAAFCRWAPHCQSLSFVVNFSELPKELVDLKGLRNLSIYLGENTIRNLSILSNLLNLEDLNLEDLSLSSNNLQKLPQSFTNLKNLKSVRFFGTRLTRKTIATVICKMKKLETLIIIYSKKSTKIPSEISELKNLHKLSLGGSHEVDQTTLINACYLPNLNELYLSFSNIQEIPQEIDLLTRLEKLDMCYNPLKESAILHICSLISLKDLSLSGCNIIELPDEFLNLTNVTTLKLSANKNITQNSLAKVFTISALEELQLEDNQLTVLPPELGNLTKLKILVLEINKLPKAMIRYVCISLPHLVELILMSNDLAELPEEIGLLKGTLRHLFLGGNPLKPGVIEHLKKLLPNTDINY